MLIKPFFREAPFLLRLHLPRLPILADGFAEIRQSAHLLAVANYRKKGPGLAKFGRERFRISTVMLEKDFLEGCRILHVVSIHLDRRWGLRGGG